MIERRRDAAVRQTKHRETRIRSGMCGDYVVNRVGRAVIDQDELEIGQRLCADAADGEIEKAPRVIYRHDDTDAGDRHCGGA
jgi:hypothetical protein